MIHCGCSAVYCLSQLPLSHWPLRIGKSLFSRQLCFHASIVRVSNPIHPRCPRRLFRVPSIAASLLYKPPSISLQLFSCSNTRLNCKGNPPPKVLAMAWQPKSLNSLGHPKYRDQFLTSVFRTTLPSSSHLLPCTLLRHPRNANLSLCHPLRTSFPYFIPSGPSIMLGSTLSLTMRTSEPLAPSHPAIVKFP